MEKSLYTDSFRTKYEAFLTGCDAVEQEGLWDVEEYGEMEVFYTGDLISVILRLVAIDGVVGQREADILNQLFGFTYSAEELAEVYEICRENIGEDFDRLFSVGVDQLARINAKLAEAYKELLALICTMIIESDGVVTDAERSEVLRLKQLCS